MPRIEPMPLDAAAIETAPDGFYLLTKDGEPITSVQPSIWDISIDQEMRDVPCRLLARVRDPLQSWIPDGVAEYFVRGDGKVVIKGWDPLPPPQKTVTMTLQEGLTVVYVDAQGRAVWAQCDPDPGLLRAIDAQTNTGMDRIWERYLKPAMLALLLRLRQE